VVDGFTIICAKSTYIRPFPVSFHEIIPCKKSPLMTSQRKALILRGSLMCQTMLANGHHKPPSFSMKNTLFTEKHLLASHSHTVWSLEPSIWVKFSCRSWKNTSQCPQWCRRIELNNWRFQSFPVQQERTGPVGSLAREKISGESTPKGTGEHHLSTLNLVPLPSLTSFPIPRKKMS